MKKNYIQEEYWREKKLKMYKIWLSNFLRIGYKYFNIILLMNKD